jgi:hypothetical protein
MGDIGLATLAALLVAVRLAFAVAGYRSGFAARNAGRRLAGK